MAMVNEQTDTVLDRVLGRLMGRSTIERSGGYSYCLLCQATTFRDKPEAHTPGCELPKAREIARDLLAALEHVKQDIEDFAKRDGYVPEYVLTAIARARGGVA